MEREAVDSQSRSRGSVDTRSKEGIQDRTSCTTLLAAGGGGAGHHLREPEKVYKKESELALSLPFLESHALPLSTLQPLLCPRLQWRRRRIPRRCRAGCPPPMTLSGARFFFLSYLHPDKHSLAVDGQIESAGTQRHAHSAVKSLQCAAVGLRKIVETPSSGHGDRILDGPG